MDIDSAERDRDYILKQEGKKEAEKKRGARDNVINVEDKVLFKNVVFPHKLTPNFQKTEFEVVKKKISI